MKEACTTLLCVVVILIMVSGCVSIPSDKLPKLTTEYTIKEKFQTVGSCGFGSGTSYNILSTDGKVVNIAGTCGYNTNLMKYYYVWSDAEPGDVVIYTQQATVTSFNEWFELRKNTDNIEDDGK